MFGIGQDLSFRRDLRRMQHLIRVDNCSAVGMAHPALVEPDGAGWHEWRPPAEGWTELLDVQHSNESDGIERLTTEADGTPGYIRATFERHEGERFWGFGERSDAVERSGTLVEHWVGEGPYRLDEYPIVEAITPRWAIRRRRDATHYPIPWLLSSRGYGVLTETHEWSCHDLSGAETWSVIALTNRLSLCVITATSPADALARFTGLTGRQPVPAASWFFGPWIQTGQADLVPPDEEKRILDALQSGGAHVSAVETHLRRLPGGAHTGRRDAERERTLEFQNRGLASLTYQSPTIARTVGAEFETALRKRLFERDERGNAITFTAYIGGREPPFSEQAQLDFTNPAAVDLYRRFVEEALEDGHDGWMEDFGEYSPLPAEHNLYPLLYHRAVAGITEDLGRRPARFVRSGWTGSAAFSPLVWGGDPTTGWGFDGLRSAVIEGLSMGLSGVAFWGSDIGGFFTLGNERLTPELLIRWIQLGALTPLMRTKAGGVAVGDVKRPQVWDRKVLPHWRRWSAFHHLLIPYLMDAAEEYARTGMPLMRHHALTHPDDRALTSLEDQYFLGPDLLVAPVLEPGARKRTVRLPAGDWVDLWRSVEVAEDGTMQSRRTKLLKGGRQHVLPAPLKEIPILVRAGARVPGIPLG
jgi:alpha-glucosidase (family GH31 glycosyl hydrolase)